MLNDDFFGPLGQIVIYCTIAVVVIAIILILACFITPGCIGYECFRLKKNHHQPPPLKQNSKANENLNLNDISYRSWRLGSLYETDHGTICESSRDSFNSSNSQFRVADSTTIMKLVPPPTKKSIKEKEFPTEVTISLRYLPYSEGGIASKLVIGVEAVSGLPPKQYNSVIEPYVALEVFKQYWTHRKKHKLYTFKTKCIRSSPINSTFRESFVITGATTRDIKEWILHIEAYDRDRYANDTKLCELQVPFKDAKKIFLTPETHLFNLRMNKCKQEFGNVLLGISYLPTAQRLTIKVMKLRNIKFAPTVASLNEFNPYVRIFQINGKTGKKIKKKKTKFIPATAEPEFNESLTFDLPVSQIDILQFLVILCSKVSVEVNNVPMMNELPSDSEESFQKSKDVSIGKIALGKGVLGATERFHWFSVLQNPRKLVTMWHTLR